MEKEEAIKNLLISIRLKADVIFYASEDAEIKNLMSSIMKDVDKLLEDK